MPPRHDRVVLSDLGRLPVFSHAGIAGELVFVSGTLGTVGDGFELVPGGAGPETTQTLHNIERILHGAGCTLADVVKVSVYVADMADFPAMNAAYAAVFPEDPPARITVGGARLALDARVEIECVARRAAGDPAKPASLRRESGHLEHDGERLYYEAVGAGPPLVLCHGAGGNHAVWYQQVPVFAAARRVVTWDHRGFGRSTDRAAASGPEAAVGDLLALLDHLEIGRADLVGQSMGGWTALALALAHPERVASLTLADTLGGIEVEALAELRRQAADGRPLDPGDTLGLHPAIDPSFRDRDPAGAYLYQMLGGMGEPDLGAIVPRLLGAGVDADALGRIDLPVLFIVGARDPLFPPPAIREAASRVPGARVVEIPRAGHSPYFEEPDAWNTALAAFLDEVGGA